MPARPTRRGDRPARPVRPDRRDLGRLRLDRRRQGPRYGARILVADHDADLFAGPLREVVAGRTSPDDERVRRAIATAVAPRRRRAWTTRSSGPAATSPAGSGNGSGWPAAVHADPEMLLAAEPTSAVDAHTEAAIAERLAAARAGRGTVVATTSPVLLDRADVVHYLVDGRVAATGTHRELLATEPGYRALVTRVFGDDCDERPPPDRRPAAGRPGRAAPAGRRPPLGRRDDPERAGRAGRPRRTVAARPDHRHGHRPAAAPRRWTGWPSACCAARSRRRCSPGTPWRSRTGSASAPRPGSARASCAGRSTCPPRWWNGCRPATWPPAAPPTSTRSPPRCATSCRGVRRHRADRVHRRRGAAGQPAARRGRACSGSPASGSSPGGTCAGPATRTCRRARPTPARRRAGRDHGGRPHDRGLRAPAAPAGRRARRDRRDPPHPAGHAGAALRVLPAGGDLVRGAGRAGAAGRRAALHRRPGQPRHGRRGRALPAPAGRAAGHHPDLDRAVAEQQRVVRPGRGAGRGTARRRPRPASRRATGSRSQASGTRTTTAATCCTTST